MPPSAVCHRSGESAFGLACRSWPCRLVAAVVLAVPLFFLCVSLIATVGSSNSAEIMMMPTNTCTPRGPIIFAVAAEVSAGAVTIDAVVEGYRSLLTTAMASYSMRASILCNSGACLSNPSAFVAGIDVDGISLSVTNGGKSLDAYPTVPTAELFTVLSYDNSPTAVAPSDGKAYKWPLKLDYSRFVNGSAQGLYAASNLLPTFVAKASLEALMYYGSRQGNGAQTGTDAPTFWFNPGAGGPSAASDPIASLSTGSFTVVPPGGGASYAMPLSNFTNVTYEIQFQSFDTITITPTNAQPTSVLVPAQLRVRETFGQFYYDTTVLDNLGRPTVRRLAGPPGTVTSTWTVKLSAVVPTSFSSGVIAEQEAIARAVDTWADRIANGTPSAIPPLPPLDKYGMLAYFSCQGAGCRVTPPEFKWPALGISAEWPTGGGSAAGFRPAAVPLADVDRSSPQQLQQQRSFNAAVTFPPAEQIVQVLYPFADGSASEGRDLTYDADARAAAKTMSQMLNYAMAVPSLNAAANNYPSAGVTVDPATGLVTELWYKFDEAFRAADRYPSFLGYTHVSRSGGSSTSGSGSSPTGVADAYPYGPPALAGTALYSLRVDPFEPNVFFTVNPNFTLPTTTRPPSSGFEGDSGSSGLDRTIIIIIICLAVFFFICMLIIIICCCCYCARRRRERRLAAAKAAAEGEEEEMEEDEEALETEFDAVVKPQQVLVAAAAASPTDSSKATGSTTIIINTTPAGTGADSISSNPNASRGVGGEPVFGSDGSFLGYLAPSAAGSPSSQSQPHPPTRRASPTSYHYDHRSPDYFGSRGGDKGSNGRGQRRRRAAPLSDTDTDGGGGYDSYGSSDGDVRIDMSGHAPLSGYRNDNPIDAYRTGDGFAGAVHHSPTRGSTAGRRRPPPSSTAGSPNGNRRPPTAGPTDAAAGYPRSPLRTREGTPELSPHRRLQYYPASPTARPLVDSDTERAAGGSTYQFRTGTHTADGGGGLDSPTSSFDDGLPALGHGGTPYRDARYNNPDASSVMANTTTNRNNASAWTNPNGSYQNPYASPYAGGGGSSSSPQSPHGMMRAMASYEEEEQQQQQVMGASNSMLSLSPHPNVSIGGISHVADGSPAVGADGVGGGYDGAMSPGRSALRRR